MDIDKTLIPLTDVLDMIGSLCSDCQAKIRCAIVGTKGIAHSRTVLDSIVSQVCVETGTTPNEVKNGGRHRALVEVRAKIARRARAGGFSFPEIGKAMNCHHTTVMHLVRTRKR